MSEANHRCEELRSVRDTLIEELRRSETLTIAGRALFDRYAELSEAATGSAPPQPAQPAFRPRPEPVDEDEDFGGSFMVRSNPTQPNIPGYRETPTPTELPRSMRDRRR
jgi:hypothetical protein